MQPTNVDSASPVASVAISASGGRPPVVRQAIPTSIAPAPIVAAAAADDAARPIVKTRATGIAAISPDEIEIAARSKWAASRTARVSTPGSALTCPPDSALTCPPDPAPTCASDPAPTCPPDSAATCPPDSAATCPPESAPTGAFTCAAASRD